MAVEKRHVVEVVGQIGGQRPGLRRDVERRTACRNDWHDGGLGLQASE